MIDYSISATSSDAADAVADLSTWWQSVTWYQLGRRPVVDVTISFGKLYQFLDDLIIVFQSGRPKQMVLEKSVDFGQSWSALQYFNRTCKSVAVTLCGFNETRLIIEYVHYIFEKSDDKMSQNSSKGEIRKTLVGT